MSQQTPAGLVAAGAAALRAGERERARQLLVQSVKGDPHNPQAWLFLAGAVTDVEQRRTCLERVLSLSPGHPAAQRGLASLPPPAPAPSPAASEAAARPTPEAPAGPWQPAPALLTLPIEAAAPPQTGARRLWLALLAFGVLLMLLGLGMGAVALAGA